MANLAENDSFDANVYELAVGDPVLGGPGGISNTQGQQLANRTRWLKNRINKIVSFILSATGIGNGSAVGTTVVSTYAMPANTLANAGDEIEFDMAGRYFNNDSLNLHLKVNGSDVYLRGIGNSVDTNILLNIKISRIASNSQVLTANYVESAQSGTIGAPLASTSISPLTMDLTIVNTITFEVQNLATGPNQFQVFRAVTKIARAQ